MRVGREVETQDPAPTVLTDANGLRFAKYVGYWIGFRFWIDSWSVLPQALMPLLLFKTDDVEESRISIISNGTMLAFENRYLMGKRQGATREFAPLVRGAWQTVVLFMRRSDTKNGTMLGYLNSALVLNVTGSPVGAIASLIDEDPYAVLSVDGGVLRGAAVVADAVDVDVYVDNLRVLQSESPSGAALVDVNGCKIGTAKCFCRDALDAPPCDADLICARLVAPGTCYNVVPGTNYTSCPAIGVEQCPCFNSMCAAGLTCRSIPANARALCHNLPPAPLANATASAAAADEWSGFGCNTARPQDGFSCEIPSVTPADWFAVIIAALLLVAALVRWSAKLLIADPAAVGPAKVADASAADDFLISGGMAFSDYINGQASLPPPPPPFAAPSFNDLVGGGSLSSLPSSGQYLSASAVRQPKESTNLVYR